MHETRTAYNTTQYHFILPPAELVIDRSEEHIAHEASYELIARRWGSRPQLLVSCVVAKGRLAMPLKSSTA
jgi:hypothetical protein